MIHYLDGGPLETVRVANGSACVVLAYDDEAKLFVYAYSGKFPRKAIPLGFVAGRGEACDFDPPPPIPAAARKPQIGEVWLMQGSTTQEPLVRLIHAADSAGYRTLTPDAYPVWYDADWALRPATPAESEPFRPIFEGLKRSLGES